jgi:hypothetical protein
MAQEPTIATVNQSYDCKPRFHWIYLFLGGFGRASRLSVWLWIVALMALWGFAISYLGKATVFYDFAPWRWLLIRNNHLSVGIVVDVIILGPAFCYHRESKKNGETECEPQGCSSSPDTDSTGIWPASVYPSRSVLLWSSFLRVRRKSISICWC